MSPAAVTTPHLLLDPGYLFIAPLGSSVPSNTVAGSVFTDAWPVAWLPLGATADGSDFNYNITVQPIFAAEFFDPLQWATTDRQGTFAFNLLDYTADNYNRALNGGVGAVTPTSGTGATALYTVEPPTPGSEIRAMVGWESLDNTCRLVAYQTLQSGQVSSPYKKRPSVAVIPMTFNFEVTSAGKTFSRWFAGANRA